MKKILLFFLIYSFSSYANHNNYVEKPIVVIIPSYNNIAWVDKNLHSIFTQEYENLHIIYVDDCSTDGTNNRVHELIKEYNTQDKITLITNKSRRGALANLYYAIHSCDDQVIIVTLDGDDWFAHEHVLTRINQEYQDPNVWLTYGQLQFYPKTNHVYCKELPTSVFKNKKLRSYQWVTSHPRTFYAWLFKRIKKEDLMYKGQFFQMTWDQAMMFPMLEMAGKEHIRFIQDVLYIYNRKNPLNDGKVDLSLVCKLERIIRKKTAYNQLTSSPKV